MSPLGARDAVEGVATGIPWTALASHDSALLAATGAGVKSVADGASSGSHYKPEILTKADAEIFEKVGSKLGTAGTVVDGLLMLNDLHHGAPAGERIGEFVGSTGAGALGAWGATVLAGSVVGPEGTLVAAIVASIAASEGGGAAGEWAGGLLDKTFGG